MAPVRLMIVGAGSRGFTYADYAAEHPDEARVVAVAEPRDFYREKMAREHGIEPGLAVKDWTELLDRTAQADAVIIATQDRMHEAPAVAFAERKIALLLEKPMAPDAQACRNIASAVRRAGILFGVCHVLRYTEYTQKIKAILDSGRIGEVVSIQHLEPVGFWHMAHSFVRGNWRNTAQSAFMLLAKSCHDLDWMRYMAGAPCERTASFGSLTHFRRERKPAEAGDAIRCLDCAFEPRCTYSARRIYMTLFGMGITGWPLDVITLQVDEAGVMRALQEGPYGRCVYECDNDVVDHQVVNLEYAGGATGSFSMIGVSEMTPRRTTLFGTQGELRGDGKTIQVYEFGNHQTETIEVPSEVGGHGGGDTGLMRAFVKAVAKGDPGFIRSGIDESLETHLTVFAAEKARLEGRVVRVEEV